MSHFSLGVIVPPDVADPAEYAAEQLEPYDENKDVPRYLTWNREIAAKHRADEIANLAAIIESGDAEKWDLPYCQERLSTLQAETDEEHYSKELETYEPADKDDQGNGYSTYNPKSKWDWWTVGGRWQGVLSDNFEPIETAAQKADRMFALLTPDGKWHARGRMGWFAAVHDEDTQWPQKRLEILAAYANHKVLMVDCHI